MPHRRPRERGSFGSHFDELLVQFPAEEKREAPTLATARSPELQQKLDLHRMLFERAWRMEEGR